MNPLTPGCYPVLILGSSTTLAKEARVSIARKTDAMIFSFYGASQARSNADFQRMLSTTNGIHIILCATGGVRPYTLSELDFESLANDLSLIQEVSGYTKEVQVVLVSSILTSIKARTANQDYASLKVKAEKEMRSLQAKGFINSLRILKPGRITQTKRFPTLAMKYERVANIIADQIVDQKSYIQPSVKEIKLGIDAYLLCVVKSFLTCFQGFWIIF